MNPLNVLVISPHPDDESIGCGGTLCRHVLNGDRVKVIFLTSGEKGGHGRSADETRVIREQEARSAAEVLGISDLEFWGFEDGGLAATDALIQRLADKIEETSAALIYLPNDNELHPDHRVAAEIAQRSEALVTARGNSPEWLMYEVWTPLQTVDVINDITPFVEAKRRAIQCYESQCAEVAFDEAIIGLNRYRGELYSWPEGDYAEVFERLK